MVTSRALIIGFVSLILGILVILLIVIVSQKTPPHHESTVDPSLHTNAVVLTTLALLHERTIDPEFYTKGTYAAKFANCEAVRIWLSAIAPSVNFQTEHWTNAIKAFMDVSTNRSSIDLTAIFVVSTYLAGKLADTLISANTEEQIKDLFQRELLSNE